MSAKKKPLKPRGGRTSSVANIDVPSPSVFGESLHDEGVTHESLRNASTWLESTKAALNASWDDPHVTASPDQEVVLEWWYGDRKLSVYFSDDESVFIKVWGSNIEDEMDEGDPDDTRAFLEAWKWLRA